MWVGILGKFSCLNCVMGFRDIGFTVGVGGYSLSLPANTAASHSLPLLCASKLRGGCFRRLTVSRKTGTPERISGMFIALRPIR